MTATLPPAQDAQRDGPRRAAKRRASRRLVVCVAIILVALGWIAVRGLTGSFVYYLTPTDVVVGDKAEVGERVRLGGYVVPASVERTAETLTFIVSDGTERLDVVDTGPVPRMFRPGQGVVLEGSLGADGVFHSDTLLVRHDGEYRAPDLPADGR